MRHSAQDVTLHPAPMSFAGASERNQHLPLPAALICRVLNWQGLLPFDSASRLTDSTQEQRPLRKGLLQECAPLQVAFYDATSGALMQQMDYSTEEAANEFTNAVFNPSGDTMVAGRQDALHAFHFNAKQGVWEEAGGKQVRPGGPMTWLDSPS